MRITVLLILSFLISGCAISYESKISLEFGGYELVKTEELEELKKLKEEKAPE